MKSLILRCQLKRCNVDNTEDMSIEKCVMNNGSPCYYLLSQQTDVLPEDMVWDKFNQFVIQKKNKPQA